MNLAGSWQSQPGCNRIQKTVEGHEKSFRFAFWIAIQHINKPRLFHEVAFLGCRNSPSAISLAATAVIDPSSKAFLQLNLPSPSFINSTIHQRSDFRLWYSRALLNIANFGWIYPSKNNLAVQIFLVPTSPSWFCWHWDLLLSRCSPTDQNIPVNPWCFKTRSDVNLFAKAWLPVGLGCRPNDHRL